MPADKPTGSEPPPWTKTARLRLPLREAQGKMASLILDGRDLSAEAITATDAEAFARRVDEWRRSAGQWIDKNIGGQASYEYRDAMNSVKSHAWANYFWPRYRTTRKKEIESEVRLLESIAQRLPEWVPSPAGGSVKAISPPARVTRRSGKEADKGAIAPDPKTVMVIYGHDREANDAMFRWLPLIGLEPKEWNELIKASGSGSPYTGDIVKCALEKVQAVVALFTADEFVQEVVVERGTTGPWRLQSRPNVLIETGMAMITHPDRFVIVCLGPEDFELPSDLDGRQYVRLDGTPERLNEIATRLEAAGCRVNRSGIQWMDPQIFPNRDGALVPPQKI
jgi:predicted nucleotide-binding protein